MAGLFDPFTPGLENPDERVAPQQQNALSGFLEDPRGRAALLQAGLSLMGGRTWGDNPTSQIARAIGGSGEAVRTSEEENRSAEEAASKIAGRKSAAGARGAAQDIAQQKLEQGQQKIDLQRERDQAKAEGYRRSLDIRQKQTEGQLAIAQDRLANAKNQTEINKANSEIARIHRENQDAIAKINSDYAQQRLEDARAAGTGVQSRFDTGMEARAAESYRKEKASHEAAQNKLTYEGPKTPFMSPDQYYAERFPSVAAARRARAGQPAPGTPTTGPVTPKGRGVAPAAPAAAPAADDLPVGTIQDGYRYTGGGRRSPDAWERIPEGEEGYDPTAD